MPELETVRATPKPSTSNYNYVLKSGNLVQIFRPDQFHEIQAEVERIIKWGHDPDGIEVALIDADDGF